MRLFKILWQALTLTSWRASRRRRRYDEIRALIVEHHMAGKGGLVLPKKYDAKDLLSFKPPMYFLARTEKNQPCIFWRKELMTEEVGPPRPVTKAVSVEALSADTKCH